MIGHVPLPVVHKDNESFLSLFPYTDFDEPHFFWNWESKRYEYLDTKRTDSRPDVWHSVIDPNTGNIDNDVYINLTQSKVLMLISEKIQKFSTWIV